MKKYHNICEIVISDNLLLKVEKRAGNCVGSQKRLILAKLGSPNPSFQRHIVKTILDYTWFQGAEFKSDLTMEKSYHVSEIEMSDNLRLKVEIRAEIGVGQKSA